MSNAVSTRAIPLATEPVDPWRVRPLPLAALTAAPFEKWIALSGSMTRAIADRFGTNPQVQPGFEGVGRFAPWEARLLGAPGRRGYVREVTLSVHGEAVLAARTLSLLDDPAVNVLRRLSNRPLAEVLFQDFNWQRITAPVPLIELGTRRVGRACLWQYGVTGSSRILVAEYFLPALRR